MSSKVMKNIFTILFALVLLAGCQKNLPVDTPEYSTLTYSIRQPEQSATKAAGQGSEINVIWYGVYHKKADGRYEYMEDMSAFVEIDDPSKINVPVTLIRNQEYKLLFLAQYRNESENRDNIYTYNVDYETGDMTLASSLSKGECLDAFVKMDMIGPVLGNENRHITLERPFAQVNVGTSATVLPSTFDLTLTGVPASYNLFTGTYSDETVSHEFKALTPAGDPLTAGGAQYTRMATVYVFGGNKIGCTLQYETSAGTTTKTISGIDTAPNFKTNIVGNL